VCNGLVRNLLKQHDVKFKLAVRKRDVGSVKQLYADTDQIILDPVSGNEEAKRNYEGQTFMIGPCVNPNVRRKGTKWEKQFYDQLGLDYTKRYSDFYIQRDYKRESLLLEKLNLPEKYIFANNRWSRGKESLAIDTELPIIYLENLSDSLFDWIPVIEKATEVHTVDTAIFHLIKQIAPKCTKVFYVSPKGKGSIKKDTFEDDLWEIR
jgi:hypothetical protein